MFYTFFSKQRLSTKYFLIIILLSFFVTNKKAEALWVFIDPANLTQNTVTAVASPVQAFGTQPIIAAGQAYSTAKESGLDAIALRLARSMLRGITAQTVNWINSGFKGNPAFLTNPETFFRDQADIEMEVLVGEKLKGLCTPFAQQIRLALIASYLQEARPPVCTINRIINSYESFTNDISKDYWKNWLDYTQNSRNNPYGSFYESRNFINLQIQTNQQNKSKQLDYGRGFLSFERCKVERGWRRDIQTEIDTPDPYNYDGNTPSSQYNDPTYSGGGNPFYDEDGTAKDPADVANPTGNPTSRTVQVDIYDPSSDYCPEDQKETLTPGSIINGQLEKVLGSSINQLELADEINEIADALMNQMFKKAIGGAISGLRGLSKKQPNERRTFLQDMLSKDPDSAASREERQRIQDIDNNIPPGIDEIIRPTVTDDGKLTVDISDVSKTRTGQYLDPGEIEKMVDSEVSRNQTKYNIPSNPSSVGTDPFTQNGEQQTP